MTGHPTWSTGTVALTDVNPRGPLSIDTFRALTVRADRHAVLHLEAARSLRDWLTWWCGDRGDTPPTAEWDRIRGPIADGRQAIRDRSRHDDCTEDERAGLAVSEHVLRGVVEAEADARRGAEIDARGAR